MNKYVVRDLSFVVRGKKNIFHLMNEPKFAAWPLIMIVFVFLFQGCLKHSAAQSKVEVCFHSGCFDVEVVSKEEDLAKGLQYRTALNKDSGMLFVFSQNGQYDFWMKDTLIPLDIIWMDQRKRVVDLKIQAPPCKENICPHYHPLNEALYVLEISGGEAEKRAIKRGDIADFDLKDIQFSSSRSQ